jgi:hypothetical protein
MKFLDRVVAGLGALLLVCIVVSVGASLVWDALPALVVLLGLFLVYRWLWRGNW